MAELQSGVGCLFLHALSGCKRRDPVWCCLSHLGTCWLMRSCSRCSSNTFESLFQDSFNKNCFEALLHYSFIVTWVSFEKSCCIPEAFRDALFSGNRVKWWYEKQDLVLSTISKVGETPARVANQIRLRFSQSDSRTQQVVKDNKLRRLVLLKQIECVNKLFLPA